MLTTFPIADKKQSASTSRNCLSLLVKDILISPSSGARTKVEAGAKRLEYPRARARRSTRRCMNLRVAPRTTFAFPCHSWGRVQRPQQRSRSSTPVYPRQPRWAPWRLDSSRLRPIRSAIAADRRQLSEVAHHASPGDDDTIEASLPPAIASELKKIDAMRVEIETGTNIEKWRFDAVRARYQALLKTAVPEPAVETAIRTRLDRLTQREQAAKAATTIQAILAQSHNRDRDIEVLSADS